MAYVRSLAKVFFAAVAVMLVSVGLPAAPAAATPRPVDGQYFPLRDDWRSGDCTMFHGAYWTLNSRGRLDFNGVVTSSDDNDAWLMHVTVLDRTGAVLGSVTNNHGAAPDWTKFVKNLPDHRLTYRWITDGSFPSWWYTNIGDIRVTGDC
jgi:hypothetical protein